MGVTNDSSAAKMKRILICGRNFHARQLLRNLRRSPENRIVGIIDFINGEDDREFMGSPVVDYNCVSSTNFDEIAIAGRYAPDMFERLVARGIQLDLIKEYSRDTYALEGVELKGRSLKTWALIDEFLEFSSNYGFDYWFVAGALLAIKRRQDFSWFADVDIAIPIEQLVDLTNAFEDFFSHRRINVIYSNHKYKSSVIKKPRLVSQIVLSTSCDLTHEEPPVIDVHSLDRDKQYALMSVGTGTVIRTQRKYFNYREEVRVNGRKISVPLNSESYLQEMYGVNWRKPAERFYVTGHLTRTNLN